MVVVIGIVGIIVFRRSAKLSILQIFARLLVFVQTITTMTTKNNKNFLKLKI
jgi:hypothetical protein